MSSKFFNSFTNSFSFAFFAANLLKGVFLYYLTGDWRSDSLPDPVSSYSWTCFLPFRTFRAAAPIVPNAMDASK
jgi:hypothetical protein